VIALSRPDDDRAFRSMFSIITRLHGDPLSFPPAFVFRLFVFRLNEPANVLESRREGRVAVAQLLPVETMMVGGRMFGEWSH
jgi:hypothetical protein